MSGLGGVYDQGCDGSVQLCELGFSLDVEPGACIRSKLEVGEGKECLALENKESEACGTAACPIGCEPPGEKLCSETEQTKR